MKNILLPLLIILIMTSCNRGSEYFFGGFSPEEASIAQIHQAVVDGLLTFEELTKWYINRIEEFDSLSGINSIVTINPNAIAKARELDDEFRNTGILRPLHGIPVIVKDNYNTRGLQTTAGSVALKGYCPEKDSYVVARLKEAGAIVLAKSNMAEWAFSPAVTISSIAGETHNPYNLDFVPAGSSGGTAAAVASNFGSVGLGTDTGNSIRGPSSHNALVGFRTTLGLISRSGIVPLYLRNDVAGPMTRTVEDAVRMLDIIAGYDPDDPITSHSEANIPDTYTDYLDADGLSGSRIGVLAELSEDDIDPQVQTLFRNALEDMKKLGAVIVDKVMIPGFDSLRRNQWCSTFKADVENWFSQQGDNLGLDSLSQIVESGKYSEYIHDRLIYHLNEGNGSNNGKECLDPYNDLRRIAFRKAIENVMDSLELDALVYPSWNFPPARIGHPEEYRGDNSQVISPHTGQPAFTIPMGYTYENLPAGIQFLGRMFDEPVLIRLCYSFEQGTKHRRSPDLVKRNKQAPEKAVLPDPLDTNE